MKKFWSVLLLALAIMPPAVALETPPPPGPPPTVTYPTPVERTLTNGLRVIAIQRTGVPLISAQLIVKSGSEADPAALPGVASLTADVLTQGTATRSATEIAQATDALGAQLTADAGFDSSRVRVNATAPRFAAAFEIFADVVRRPVFAPEEVERARTQALSSLQLTYSNPSSLAPLVAERAVYGDAPYGHPADGTPKSVSTIARAQLQQFHQTYYRPDNAVLLIGGDIAPEAAFALAERVFGDWQKPATALPAPQASPVTAPTARVVVIDQPEAGRTAIVVSRIGIERADPSYFAGIVSNAVLSGYSGRLNSEVRIKRGLSYGASASLEARREPGPFTAGTLVDHTRAAEGAQVMLATIASLAAQPVGAGELKPRKAVVTGGFARSLETIDGLVAQVGRLALYGLPLEDINRYIPSTEAVSPEQIQQFATAHLKDNLSLVLVGNAKLFLPQLQKQFPALEVIPFAKLDLGQANLGRTAKVADK
ncbi:M16 family metallopeptidase [Gloeobacter kilaueensis]|uniref:Peptidase M16 domain-containing protein n=1 Tax=Gloeobacter kilaueensis (strain ATCC BAA-2537 / CCAP 1431/1 / ULC 316 / JS1) TaxID=1183438 RepID=U5QQU8_GLOK1|nr:pitrilysin family protein [Gloeobacter kilaueensis]AGY60014.1 peptidase M16 domain-containing protein [Gloeobacter kilaueensis JS1]